LSLALSSSFNRKHLRAGQADPPFMARSAVWPTGSVCGCRLKSALPRPPIGRSHESRLSAAARIASHPICRVGFFFSRWGASATLVRTQTRAPPERERISRSCLLVSQAFSATVSALQLQRQAGSARRKKKVHAGRQAGHARDHRCGSLLTTWCGLQLSDQGSSVDTSLFPSDSSASR
jgi:hypothetical protein